jgi:type II secretion system protein N
MSQRHKIMLWTGIVVYGLVLFAVLTFYRLPADKILSKALETATQGKVFVSAEKVSSSLWKGYRLENLTWTVQSGSAVVSDRMESLTLSPRYLGLLQGYLPVQMEGVMAKGTFQASAGVSMIHGLSKGYASLKALGIDLGALATVDGVLQREIKGKLTAQADFYGPLNELRKLNGQATILVVDGTVDTRVDSLGFRTIPFEKLSLPFTVRNGVASLKGGQLIGPVLAGELEGQIRLLQNLQVSPLQITATMRPGPSLTGEKGGSLPMTGDKPFVIQLQGTIGKPLFSLAGG